MDIREALAQLDSMTDEQWTADGAPKIDVVSELLGRKVTRQEILDAAPSFNRSNTTLEEAKAEDKELEAAPGAEAPEYMTQLADLASKEPMTERQFTMFFRDFPTEGLPDLEKILLTQISIVEESERAAQELKARAKVSLASVRSRIKAEIPDFTNQSAIQNYLKSQADLREAKVMATREILKGLDVSKLDPRAAIDRAMARKTQRGTQRPKV